MKHAKKNEIKYHQEIGRLFVKVRMTQTLSNPQSIICVIMLGGSALQATIPLVGDSWMLLFIIKCVIIYTETIFV